MVVVNLEACKGCTLCEKNCPLDAVHVVDRKAVVSEEKCAECGICTRVCKFGAIERPAASPEKSVVCSSCPVQCHVPVGHTGACKRYTNEDGKLVRNTVKSETWISMWLNYYCELDVPSIPDVAGEYTIEIYFNSMFAHKQTFTVV